MTAVKRIVLTGASGFVGQHVLHHFMSRPNLEIHALCFHNIDLFSQAVNAATCVVDTTRVICTSLDITNKEAVNEWISQHSNLDICLHLAATSFPKVCEEHPVKAMACNNPTFWFQALARHKIPIVALSTDQVYDGTKGSLYVETDATNPVNVYGTTKVAMEESLMATLDTRTVILRSSIVLGPLAPLSTEISHSTFLHFCAGRQNKETDFYTDECRTVVSVDDVVDVLWYFCQVGVADDEQSKCTIYNMGGKDKVSRFDMALAVFCHFGYNDKYLVAKEKSKLPPGPVASPLDISMDSCKLSTVTGIGFKGLDDIVLATFPQDCNATL